MEVVKYGRPRRNRKGNYRQTVKKLTRRHLRRLAKGDPETLKTRVRDVTYGWD